MSVLNPKTIYLSAQSLRPIRASTAGDGALFVGDQTIADYDYLMEDDENLECPSPHKRRRLNFLSPEQKLVRRLVTILQWLSLPKWYYWCGWSFNHEQLFAETNPLCEKSVCKLLIHLRSSLFASTFFCFCIYCTVQVQNSSEMIILLNN